MIDNGYLKVRESLYAQVISWVNIVLHHIDFMKFISRMKILACYLDVNGSKDFVKYPYHIEIEHCDTLVYRYPNGIYEKDNTNQTLH